MAFDPQSGNASIAERKDTVLGHFIHLIELDEEYYKDPNAICIRNHEMYQAEAEDREIKEPGQVKRTTASLEFYNALESMWSAVGAVTYGDDPWFTPWSDELDEKSTDNARNTYLVMNQQHVDMGYRLKAEDSGKWCALHGTGVVYVPWLKKTRYIERKNGWKEESDYDGPGFEHIPIWTFHHAPLNALEIDEMDMCSFEYEMTEENLKKLLRRRQAGGATVKLDFDAHARISTEGVDIDTALERKKGYRAELGEGYVHIDHVWGLHPKKKHPEKPEEPDPRIYEFIIVNRREIVSEQTNPHWHGKYPLLKYVYVPQEKQFRGRGAADLTFTKMRAIDNRRNLADFTLKMANFGIYQRTGTPHISAMVSRMRMYPGKIIDPGREGILTPFQTNTQGLKPSLMMDTIDIDELRRALAATESIQAVSKGGTATETRQVAMEAARRIGTFAIRFGEFNRAYLKLQGEMCEQYLPKKIAVAMRKEDGGYAGKIIAKDNMLRRVRYEMKIALDLESRPKMARNINQTLSNIVQILQIAPQAQKAVLSTIFQLIRKTLPIYGINPIDALPFERVEEAMQAPVMPEEMIPAPDAKAPPMEPAGRRR